MALPSCEHFGAFVEPDPDARARTANVLSSSPDQLPDAVAIVHTSLDIASAGDRLSDEQAAHLAVALIDNAGRDAAWKATTGESWQHELWLDMTRRVPPHHVATPANLAAWNAWRRSEPALAWAALAKAVQAEPDNTMSPLISIVLASGTNPATLPWPMTDGTDLENPLQ